MWGRVWRGPGRGVFEECVGPVKAGSRGSWGPGAGMSLHRRLFFIVLQEPQSPPLRRNGNEPPPTPHPPLGAAGRGREETRPQQAHRGSRDPRAGQGVRLPAPRRGWGDWRTPISSRLF